jgi:hypothetical protein
MKKIEINPGFEAKLQRLGIKEKFIENCKNSKWDVPSKDYVDQMNKATLWDFFIIYAFNWKDTPEGFDFWANIADK